MLKRRRERERMSLRSMGVKRSGWSKLKVEIYGKVFVMFVFIYAAGVSLGVTTPNDVAAINSLYISLGSPVLPGWVASGGDPCGQAWQGVLCDSSSSEIMSITLNGANLGGELGNDLATFASIRTIDFSNNHIGGSIPSNLPTSLQTFFLSANNFTGSIPDEFSSLTLLTDMSLNRNSLSGEIPDAFASLVGLINLDLSDNNLSGQLPPSFQNLANLRTLHLQDNQLSGTLGVLGDLYLQDLNVENNMFMGPIPENLFTIANFK